MKTFGLIGNPLSHSFSPTYFKSKFEKLGIDDCEYRLFPLDSIDELPELINNTPNLCGLNVTIPFKQEVIPFLDGLMEVAEAIGAVNTIAFKEGKLIGHNTDVIGFTESIKPLLKQHHSHALVLGNGGAAQAIVYALNILGIETTIVSRNASATTINYASINQTILEKNTVIVNTTPLGMSPNLDAKPTINYANLSVNHLLYDIIYNPLNTRFLKEGVRRGCSTANGLEMLKFQADASWGVWNN